MSRYHRASLAAPPSSAIFSHGELLKRPDDWEHTGERWRLVIYDYEGWLEFKGERVAFTPGSLFVLPPNAHFKQDRYSPELYVMYANFHLSDSDEHMMALPLHCHLGEEYASRKLDWHNCVRRLDMSSMPARVMVHHLLWHVAAPLSKFRKRVEVDEAEHIMRRRMAEPLSIQGIADEVGISQNQLIRLFRQEHGLTPISFLRNLRAEEAKRLLVRTDRPIKEIAADVGVPNLHYFNAFVREYFGDGPRALRERGRDR